VYLLAILVVVALILVFVGRAGVSPSPEPIPVDGDLPLSEQVSAIQVNLLREQLEENKGYNDRLLQIVLWSLSTVVGVAAAVLGANLFASYRATQRERELLQDTKTSLDSLEKSYEESRSRLAGFIVETAIKAAERETPLRNYQEAIDALHKVCVEGEVKAGGSEIARAWMTAVNAVLSNITDDLENGLPMAVEQEVVEKLREPVTTIGNEFWGIRWQVVLVHIDTIARTEPVEDAPRDATGTARSAPDLQS
jgi:hypothetical protein